jgi:hypothetical protein
MEPRERIDALLDLALRNYGTAEPRIGLEGRILAQFEAEPSQASQ